MEKSGGDRHQPDCLEAELADNLRKAICSGADFAAANLVGASLDGARL